MNLKEIINQLELCKFTDELGHSLENNIAFIELKKMSEEENDSAIKKFARKYKNIL